jgi:hypothetical protein
MARNISFTLTQRQIRKKTKTVTRRLGWKFLKVGDEITACEKCQGLKPGQVIKKICKLKVISVRREMLSEMLVEPYGSQEAKKEGFPLLSGQEFVDMFCQSLKCHPKQTVTRIEFEYCKAEYSKIDC